MSTDMRDDLTRYLNASQTLDTARSQVAALEQSAAVETFNNQMALLQRLHPGDLQGCGQGREHLPALRRYPARQRPACH